MQWEAATAAARDAGVRVVNLRTGLVLGKEGELLPKLTLLTRLMLGGRLGSGQAVLPVDLGDRRDRGDDHPADPPVARAGQPDRRPTR